MQLNRTRNDKRRMYFQEKKLLRQLLFTQTQSGSGFTTSEMAGSHNEYETHLLQRQPSNLFYSTSLRYCSSLVLMPASYNAV